MVVSDGEAVVVDDASVPAHAANIRTAATARIGRFIDPMVCRGLTIG